MSNAAPIVIGLGELLWDVFPDRRLPGGAPANVAYQAGQLGCCGVVVSRVGTDDLGNELCGYLDEKGLASSSVQRDPEHPTGRVTVELAEDGQPDFTIHEHVAWDFLEFDDSLRQIAGQAAAVCFGTLAQRSPITRQTIHQVLASTQQDCLRVYDVNLRQQFYDRSWIEPSLERASVVKLNHEEVEIISGLLELPSDPIGFRRCRPGQLRHRLGLHHPRCRRMSDCHQRRNRRCPRSPHRGGRYGGGGGCVYCGTDQHASGRLAAPTGC